MEFRLLGPLEVADGDASVRIAAGKQRALLAVLLLDANRAVAASRLVDDLWGDEVPASAAKMVQIYVSRLRKALPGDRLETRGSGYLLRVEPDEVDLERFQRIATEARGLAGSRPGEALELFEEALALWRGPALAEFDEPFARAEADRLEELRLSVVEDAMDARLALGRHADLVGELDSLVARHPHRERLRARQMLALYRSGRQSEALEAYAELRHGLDEELGIAPSPELRALERAILNQDPELLVALPEGAERGPSTRRSDMAGRSREWAELESALRGAREGRTSVVFLTGEVGAGKTTLLESFLDQESGRTELLVGRGQCLDQRGAGEAFLPLLHALGSLARVEERVQGLLATHAPTWALQLPWLASGDELEAVRERAAGATSERMLRELAELLVDLSSERPVVIALEDLHWSDPSTLDAIELLARRHDAARLLVAGTYVSGASEEPAAAALATELQARRLCRIVGLAPLDAHQLADLVEQRLPGTGRADELAATLVTRTAGNPLFASNVVDTWIESGGVKRVGDRWSVAADIEDLSHAVPPTLRELVEHELGRLDVDDLATLEVAAIAGGDAPSRMLALVLGDDPSRVDARCADLTRRSRLLAPASGAPWPDGTTSPAYRFVHELYEQVVYERIPPLRRAELHAAFARELESAWGERAAEIAPTLAAHAGRAGLPDAAVRYLRLTAEIALDRTAHREAADLLERALATLTELPEGAGRDRLELELHSLLGRALVVRDGWPSEDAEREFLTAAELCERLGDREPLVPLLIGLATIYEVRGEFERAHEILERSLELAAEDDTDRRIEAHEVLACSLLHRGSFTAALEHAEHGVRLFRSSSYRPVVVSLGEDSAVSCHDWLALALWYVGYPDQARDRAHEAVAIAEEPGRSYGLAAAIGQAAVVHQCRREPSEALAWARRTVELAERLRYTYRAAVGRIVAGWAQAVAGDPAGLVELREGIEAASDTGIRMDDAYFLGLLADALLELGDADGGLRAADDGLRHAGDPAESFYGAELLRLRGELRLRRGDEAGREDLRRAVAVARSQQSRSLELRAATSVVRHDGAGARAELATIVERFDEGRDTVDVVQARALLDQPLDDASLGG